MRKLKYFFEEQMNNFNIMKKLIFIYVFCVIIPLVITDTVILFMLVRGQEQEQQYEYDHIADAIHMEMQYTITEATQCINTIYVNRSVNEFLDKEFLNEYDYYDQMQQVLKKAPIDMYHGYNISNVVLYADNETIVNGGHFQRLARAEYYDWYEKLGETDETFVMDFYYVGDREPWTTAKRRITLARYMNYEKNTETRKVVSVDLEYARLARKIINLNYGHPLYVCMGDRILFSNDGHYASDSNYQHLTGKEEVVAQREFPLLNQSFRVLFMKSGTGILDILYENKALLCFLIAINLILPYILVNVVNRSFTSRLLELSKVFDNADAERLLSIETTRGTDEIGKLMRNYNRMADRMNELIQTVYKDRIEKQEIDIARKNAELLALHAQINPHFLFNVLESIRMSCLLKKETDTAFLIEKLAILERNTVSWKKDKISVADELSFAKAYLELQKHRFGERLKYEIEVDEKCYEYMVPKLTIVTFVENACVHGSEKKASTSWIYLRIYEKNEMMYIEIEDTGCGMEEEYVTELLKRMQNSSIQDLRGASHVGILNACLRLRMISEEKARFEIESEKGVGTFIVIKVPVGYLKE